MNKQKILITGGTGFVGSYLLRYLVQKGYEEIYALKRSTSSMALVTSVQENIKWIEGDLLDIPLLEEVMEGVAQVYHCAAMVSFNPKDAPKMYETNVKGTANIVNVALHKNIKKLVHVSSIATLSGSKQGEWVDETTKWKDDKKASNYARSKYLAEMEVWRAIQEGLNAAILNPALILGSGFWDRGTGAIFRLYGAGFPFYSTGIGGIVDVRDVAKLAIQLMESDIQEERFIVSAENIAYRELFSKIAALAEKKQPSIPINSIMTSIGWRLDWLKSKLTGISPTITKETVQSAANQTYYDNKKSIDSFDFQYTPIQQTLEETVKQLKQARQGKELKPMALPLN